MNITRKFEKRIVYTLGVWQIIDGLITILFYGMHQKNRIMNSSDGILEQNHALESIFGSIFNFITIFGLFLIGMGLINMVVAKNHIKDTRVNYKVGFWLLLVGLLSYFIMDILSMILSLSAGVIYLAKNKSIQMLNNQQ